MVLIETEGNFLTNFREDLEKEITKNVRLLEKSNDISQADLMRNLSVLELEIDNLKQKKLTNTEKDRLIKVEDRIDTLIEILTIDKPKRIANKSLVSDIQIDRQKGLVYAKN